jgi:hypothetical protein
MPFSKSKIPYMGQGRSCPELIAELILQAKCSNSHNLTTTHNGTESERKSSGDLRMRHICDSLPYELLTNGLAVHPPIQE